MEIYDLCSSARGAHFAGKVGLVPLSRAVIDGNPPLTTTARAILMVTFGSVYYNMCNRTGLLTANCFADLSVNNGRLHIHGASADLSGYLFLFTSEYVVGLFRNRPPFSPDYVNYMAAHRVCQVPEDTMRIFISSCDSLMASMLNGANIHRERIIAHKTIVFYMEIASYFESIVHESSSALVRYSNRSMQLFTRFVTLLEQRAKTEHGAEYYASALSVTPQYLNRVVRSVSGRSLSAMVADSVLGEAKRLLTATDLTLGEIAAEMNFADQAVFSKFFKRLTGEPPLRYRNKK